MADLTFTGTLAADPETVQIHGGRTVARLTIVEPQHRKNPETGEREVCEPNTFRVQARDSYGRHVAQSLREGDEVTVVGHIVTTRWTDKDSGRSQTTQVVVAEQVTPTTEAANEPT